MAYFGDIAEYVAATERLVHTAKAEGVSLNELLSRCDRETRWTDAQREQGKDNLRAAWELFE